MRRRYLLRPWHCFLLTLVCIAVFPTSGGSGREQAPVHIEPELPPASVQVRLDEAEDAAISLPRLHSLLVSWRGERIVERYYNGARADRLANIKSASKSVLSALVGIAIERGHIAGVKEPIEPFFRDLLASERDGPKRAITVEDLLTMQSGLETTSNRNYGAWVLSSNWVRHALTRPLRTAPGTYMEYSTGNTHLLSAILTKATGQNTWQFAQETLAGPMGFTLTRWPQDPQGIYFGGNDMLMTPRQMLAFGEMYLNGGRAGDRQIVPERWVSASLTPYARSPRERDRFYGYGWWIRELGGYQTYYAWGYGGQFIFIVPGLDLVAVTTSASTVSDDRFTHRRTVYDLVEDLVIRPVASVMHGAAAARVQ